MVSVSSNLRTTLPPCIFAYSELITTPLEWPRVRGPLGLGANLRTTEPVSPGNSLSPSIFRCFSLSRASGATLSSSALTASRPSLRAIVFAFSTSSETMLIKRLASDLKFGLSDSSLPSTLPTCPLPLYSSEF